MSPKESEDVPTKLTGSERFDTLASGISTRDSKWSAEQPGELNEPDRMNDFLPS